MIKVKSKREIGYDSTDLVALVVLKYKLNTLKD